MPARAAHRPARGGAGAVETRPVAAIATSWASFVAVSDSPGGLLAIRSPSARAHRPPIGRPKAGIPEFRLPGHVTGRLSYVPIPEWPSAFHADPVSLQLELGPPSSATVRMMSVRPGESVACRFIRGAPARDGTGRQGTARSVTVWETGARSCHRGTSSVDPYDRARRNSWHCDRSPISLAT